MTISFRQLITSYLLLMSLCFAVGFAITGGNSWFDTGTLLLSCGLSMVLLVAVHLAPRAMFGEIVMLIIFIGLFFLPRILCYLLMPDKLAFSYGEWVTADYINKGLLFILLGTGAIVAGFFTAQTIFKAGRVSLSSVSMKYKSPSVRSLALIFFISSLIDLWLVVVMKVTMFQEEKGIFHSLIMAIRTLISNDTAYFFLLGILIASDVKSRMHRILFYLVPLVYGIYITIGGSKGAILRIVFSLLLMFVCRLGNFRFRTMMVVPIVLVSIAIGVVSYTFGLASRMQLKAEANISVSQALELSNTVVQQSQGLEIIIAILDRLGSIDYPISIISRPETENDHANKYLKFSYVIKSFLNSVLPGTPFPEALYPTSRLLAVIYGPYVEENLEYGFNTEPWTIWGVSFAYFGWTGGFFFIFFSAIILHLFLLSFSNFATWTPQLRFVAETTILFWLICGAFYNNMGLDYAAAQCVFVILQMICIYFLGHFIDFLFREWECVFRKPLKTAYEPNP